MAWDDEPWTLDGAAVRISIIGFDDGLNKTRSLNGDQVSTIFSDLTGETDVTGASRLSENARIGFIGIQTLGVFDIDSDTAEKWQTALPLLPDRPNNRELRPYMNAFDIVRR